MTVYEGGILIECCKIKNMYFIKSNKTNKYIKEIAK